MQGQRFQTQLYSINQPHDLMRSHLLLYAVNKMIGEHSVNSLSFSMIGTFRTYLNIFKKISPKTRNSEKNEKIILFLYNMQWLMKVTMMMMLVNKRVPVSFHIFTQAYMYINILTSATI